MEISTFIFCCAVTIGAYLVSLKTSKRFPSPFTTPVFFSTVVIISIFLLFDVDIASYEPAKEVLTFLLGPATVALAVPLYKNRAFIARYWKAIALGLTSGSLATILSAVLILKAFGVDSAIVAAISAKSVTVPIALEIVNQLGGNQPLTTAFVVFTGISGAMIAPSILNLFKITQPIARGLVYGTLSHGQGTAQASIEGELPGAVAGVCMGLAAIFTAFVAPVLVPFFL